MSATVGRPVVTPERLAPLVSRLRSLYGLDEATEGEAIGWAEVLGGLDACDAEDAWALLLRQPPERCPTAAAMRERVLVVTRKRVAEQAQRALEPGGPERKAEMLRVGRLNAVWWRVVRAIFDKKLPDDHVAILRMPDDELAAALGLEVDEYRRRVERWEARAERSPAPAGACGRCGGVGHVSNGDGAAMPCRECRPEQAALWRAGHFQTPARRDLDG